MEELWKKFKEETKQHLDIINNYIEETSLNKQITGEIELSQSKSAEKVTQQISQQMYLDEDEKSPLKKKPRSPRKRIYGSLKDTVKELMEKGGISRAQAYRKAKKMMQKT